MSHQKTGIFKRFLLVSCVLSPAVWGSVQAIATAQPYPPCQPPAAGEYLLFIRDQPDSDLTQIQQILPRGTITTICDYLETAVLRVSGFTSRDIASSWAQYLAETESLQTFVVQPPAIAPASDREPAPAYAPRPLGVGYAVIVHYFDRPEIAVDVQRLLDAPVGLIVYGEQPYLLAAYTDNPDSAASVLQTLSDRNFTAAIIDSRDAVLLTPEVAILSQ
ncbi:MAG TPA: hypothetical protein ACFE0H_05025 [Elainellaceae cyanobacterium]